MSINIYQIHIKTDKMDEIKDFLVDWLEDKYGYQSELQLNQDSFFPFFENEVPTHFTLSVLHEEWISILHDSYDQLIDLTSRLSATFNTLVIHAIGQSTVDTYNLNIFQDGDLIRKIDCGEGYLGIEQYGEPLPFEKSPIGRKSVLEDEDSYFFDYKDMQEYCLHFNIDILMDPSVKDGSWEVIKIQKDPELTRPPHKLSFINKILLRNKKKRN